MDFPGHYIGRIRSDAVSISSIISPHSSPNAMLALTKHQCRGSSTAATARIICPLVLRILEPMRFPSHLLLSDQGPIILESSRSTSLV